MRGERLEKWARVLVDYCVAARPGESILVSGGIAARDLIEACYQQVVLRGAHSVLRINLPGLARFTLEHASDEQLAYTSPVARAEAEQCAGRIAIHAETNTRAMSGIDPRRQGLVARASEPLRKLILASKWCGTQFPTDAYAQDADMALEAYEDFVAGAMFLDRPDPIAEWRELGRSQQGLVDFMTGVRTVRIEADGTDLTLSVEGRTWINSDGRHNMPSGEIFTGPVETSARGPIRCTFPVCRDGREIAGIELEFAEGRVVRASAAKNQDYLAQMLALDAGASRLGELGIGLNAGIQTFTRSILYDEKIGGTVHLALGNSYPETGGQNVSALHWDLIVDLRPGGRITADDRVVMEDGRWLVGTS